MIMEDLERSTPSPRLTPEVPLQLTQAADEHALGGGAGGGDHAHLYVLVVLSFYGVFLCGIMLGYFRSKRREKRRVNVFTRLVHEEQQREWGALPKKRGLAALACAHVHVPFCDHHGNQLGLLLRQSHEGSLPSPLACACAEQSSVSSLCSSSDTRVTIEEETFRGGWENSDSG